MPLPGAAKELFTTDNSGGTCAAFSQTWLALSLIGNKPLENPGIVQSQGLMKEIQSGGAGGPSVQALQKNGIDIGGGITILQNATWAAIFQQVASSAAGFYYISMKSPFHANACYISSAGEIYYLEPEVGCYKYTNATPFNGNVPGWYQTRTGQTTNTEFKIYPVKPLA